MNWKWIIIHSLLLYIVSWISGFIIGFTISFTGQDASIETPLILTLIGLSNLFFIFFGIMLIAIIQRSDWIHFIYVWIVLSIASIPNLLIGFTLREIINGCIFMLVVVMLGKLFGLLISKGIDTVFKKTNS